jgi:hypothetical protein
MPAEARREPTLLYWLLTAGAITFGVLGAASIGLPLFLLGLVLVIRGVVGRPQVGFWPPVVGIVLFFIAFQVVGALYGPLSCSTVYSVTTQISAPGESEHTTIENTRTTCDSPFLPSRIEGVAPPLWPIILGAVGIGFAGAWVTRVGLTRTLRERDEEGGSKSGLDPKHAERSAGANLRYWLLTGFLIVFGFLGMLSVGIPLLVLGLALAALADVRDRPEAFWPPLTGIVLFFATYILVAPLGCSQTATLIDAGIQPQASVTTCTRILPPDYTGIGEPPVWPTVTAAAATGLFGAMVIRHLLIRRRRRNDVAEKVRPTPPPGEA